MKFRTQIFTELLNLNREGKEYKDIKDHSPPDHSPPLARLLLTFFPFFGHLYFNGSIHRCSSVLDYARVHAIVG